METMSTVDFCEMPLSEMELINGYLEAKRRVCDFGIIV